MNTKLKEVAGILDGADVLAGVLLMEPGQYSAVSNLLDVWYLTALKEEC